MKRLKASSLPTVLVISVLVMILVLMAFEFWNMNSFYYLRYHFDKQQKMHLSSVLTIYCNDSVLAEQIKSEQTYQLYEDDERSSVSLTSYQWGLYECVEMYNYDKSIHSVQFIGKAQDTRQAPGIWLCDRDHPLSLSGEATISGELFLPRSGINYMDLPFDSFRGETLPSESIHISSKDLPPVDSTYLQSLRSLKEPLSAMANEIPPHYYSFSNDPLYVSLDDAGEELYAKGRLVLYGDEVHIKASDRISDVILIARHVTIESGFSGALQIMASDTVEIEQGAYLHYPSGVYLHGDRNKSYLHVGANSHIEGYAIVEGNADGANGFIVDIHYRQDEGSQLTGLLFVDGTAHLEGSVSGAAYLKECYYLSGENMYSGVIYNGRIERSEDIAFPFLFKESDFEKKRVKKVE